MKVSKASEKQQHPPEAFDDFEIVVVNDGSPDPKVRETLDSYDDPKLKVIHSHNQGFTRAISLAVAKSTGEYVAVQGAGDISLPGRLAAQVAALDADPDLVGASCPHWNLNIGGPHDGRKHLVALPARRITLDTLSKAKGCPLNHGAVTFRRSAYDLTGGYRPFFAMAQDWDLWIRMSEYGDFVMLDEPEYQRLVFAADGIASKVDKSLSQLRYGQIAKGSLAERQAWGVDSIDVFGSHAPLYSPPSKVFSKAIARTAIKYLRDGHMRNARYFAQLAYRTGFGMSHVLALILTARGINPSLSIWIANKLPIIDRRAAEPVLPEFTHGEPSQSI